MNKAITIVIAGAMIALPVLATAQDVARGIVFHDQNNNGVYDPGEPGVPDVLVGNGREAVRTGADGRYEISITDDTIIFVNKPSGWMTGIDSLGTPQFYYIHKPAGSPPDLRFPGVPPTGPLPESVNFPLYKQDEPDHFQAIFFGDTQPRSQREVDWLAHDVMTELIGNDKSFAVILGDLVFDDLRVFEPLKNLMSVLEIPIYYVIGNHDINFDVPDRTYSTEAYQVAFGPPYHAFAYGRVHFLAMNNIDWLGDKYEARFGEDQLAYFESYLAQIPEDSLVVPTMHIPIIQADDKERIFTALQRFENSFSASAHYHRQIHVFMDSSQEWPGDEPHHHFIAGTACGSWLSGVYDELGIPHSTMSDGTPNGYTIVTFDGTDYRMEYKAARRPASYQMNIWTPDGIPAADVEDTEIVVNVFIGSPRSTVEMRVRGTEEWTPLEHTVRPDPYFAAHKNREIWLGDTYLRPALGVAEDQFNFNNVPGMLEHFARRLPNPNDSQHIWVAKLPAGLTPGTHVIEVRTTDMFGQSYTGHRIVRVVE